MRLPKGLIIQSQWPHHNHWAAVKVVQELPDGRVEVVSIETGGQAPKPRSTLFLAPDFVEQTFASNAELAAFRRQLAEAESEPLKTEFRTGRDADGKFSVDAKYVRMDGDNVILRRRDNNKELKVPRSRLSQSDQQFVLQKGEKATASPFD